MNKNINKIYIQAIDQVPWFRQSYMQHSSAWIRVPHLLLVVSLCFAWKHHCLVFKDAKNYFKQKTDKKIFCNESIKAKKVVRTVYCVMPTLKSMMTATLVKVDLTYLWPSLLVIILMSHAMNFEAMGLKRAALSEWLLTEIALVGANT